MRVPAGGGEPLLEVEVPRGTPGAGPCVVKWLPSGLWTGTCESFGFTGTCKHIDKIRTRIRGCETARPAGERL